MSLFKRTNYKIFFKSKGEPLLWLTAGGLVIALLMIFLLLFMVIKNGFSNYWPVQVVSLDLKNGEKLMGEITKVEIYTKSSTDAKRYLVRIGNFELTNEHFRWVNESDIDKKYYDRNAVLVERLEWGRFYGFPKAFRIGDNVVTTNITEIFSRYEKYHDEARDLWRKKVEIEKVDIGRLNHEMEKERLAVKEIELKLEDAKLSGDKGRTERLEKLYNEKSMAFAKFESSSKKKYDDLIAKIDALKSEYEKYSIDFETADGKIKNIKLHEIVRSYLANNLSVFNKTGIYVSRWVEFLTDEPREANSEGGVFPAIFGTVVMTIIMSLFVVPFGVMAAIYMKEYAKSGKILSILRIAINNLAGVPSIVYGVFGLGFFAYTFGAAIDKVFYSAKLPSPTFGTGGILWSALTLALLTLPVVIVATEEAINAVPNSLREGSYACGATKWQTIRYIVLPRALPGIMTGFILAMSRGAGEVAPLMLVGAVKLAPEMPIDGIFPYIHLERSFMHLGFHIYDLGFQSQNSEAAIPMVYTTTLLLITIVVVLNVMAIYIRNKLRKKFVGSVF